MPLAGRSARAEALVLEGAQGVCELKEAAATGGRGPTSERSPPWQLLER